VANPILLSVFEPFGKSAVNASQVVGEALAAQDPRIELLTLPVVRGLADDALLTRLRQTPAPSFAIALGEAGPEPIVRLEKVAINYDDFRIPDNNGEQPRDVPILADGPPAYFATFPVSKIAKRLDGVTPLPVRVSLSAGAFLCNHIAYKALDFLASNPVCPFVFIHLPNWRADTDYPLNDITVTVTAVLNDLTNLLDV
jgi:pyroglutamyl-peptidase